MIKILRKLLKYLNEREQKKKRIAYVQGNFKNYMPLKSYKQLKLETRKLDKINEKFLKKLEGIWYHTM